MRWHSDVTPEFTLHVNIACYAASQQRMLKPGWGGQNKDAPRARNVRSGYPGRPGDRARHSAHRDGSSRPTTDAAGPTRQLILSDPAMTVAAGSPTVAVTRIGMR